MERQSYTTDLSDKEWSIVEPYVPAPMKGGRPPKWSRREILNAILYVLKTGCPWQLLPHDFPPYSTVFGIFVAGVRKVYGRVSIRYYGKRHARNWVVSHSQVR